MSPRQLLLLACLGGPAMMSAAEPVAPTTPPVAKTAAPASPSPAPAVTAPAPARTDSTITPAATFDAFRVVSDRNIFNPNRTGRRDRTSEEQPPRVDQMSLVGTMESDRGLRAFFDGSEAGYRRAVRVGEKVDQFKVTQISAQSVEVEREGKSVTIRVGQQLRRTEGADWDLVGEDVLRREVQARVAAEAKSDASAPQAIPAGASDIEKRMRERRMKDFKR